LENSRVFLEEPNIDLAKVKNIQFFFKHIQAVDTSRRLMVSYGSTAIRMTCITTEVRGLLENCKREWLRIYPHLWDKMIHQGPFPEIRCILDWARGTKHK